MERKWNLTSASADRKLHHSDRIYTFVQTSSRIVAGYQELLSGGPGRDTV